MDIEASNLRDPSQLRTNAVQITDVLHDGVRQDDVKFLIPQRPHVLGWLAYLSNANILKPSRLGRSLQLGRSTNHLCKVSVYNWMKLITPTRRITIRNCDAIPSLREQNLCAKCDTRP